MCSNDVLSLGGIDRLHSKLGSKERKICIVGGAHSAFSVAWLCMHGEAAQFSKNFFQLDTRSRKRASPSCSATKTEHLFSYSLSFIHDEARVRSAADSLVNVYSNANKRCVSITILHRSPVRVFYSSKNEADSDNYTDYKQTNRHGQIHAFAGLRGDAKDMYNDILNGREVRVRLCQIKSGGSKKLIGHCFDEAQVIVWATGYKSHTIPITDAHGVAVSLATVQGQVQIDRQGRLLKTTHLNDMPSILLNMYGNGHGYGLPAVYKNGEFDGSKGRADGIAVYMKQGAEVILRTILSSSWLESVETITTSSKCPGRIS